MTLTPAGERVVNEARLLLKHAAEFAQNALDLGDALRGEIVVGCFLTLAVRFMPALLARFAQLHPGITVELHEGDQEELIAMLLSGRAELALAYGFAMPDEIAGAAACRTAARMRSSLPTIRSPDAATVSLRELAEEPYILLDLPHSRDYFFGLFRAVGRRAAHRRSARARRS